MDMIWREKLVGAMYVHEITQRMLAQKLGRTPEYVNLILRGKRDPKKAPAQFGAALEALLQENAGNGPSLSV